MEFLCDEMLQSLGRWLRTAGYDVIIENSGRDDREVIAQAGREGRILLTRDRRMLEHKAAAGRVMVLSGKRLEENVDELCHLLPINWLLAPFSRCRECNSPLRAANAAQQGRVPAEFQNDSAGLHYCPRCDKAYWNGGHVARMRKRLQAWQRLCT